MRDTLADIDGPTLSDLSRNSDDEYWAILAECSLTGDAYLYAILGE